MRREKRTCSGERAAAQNFYQGLTSAGKLRGQYYTPDELVSRILEGLDLTAAQLIIDPACGDGSFLRGVVAAVARQGRGADREELASHWSRRLVGFDLDEAAVAAARAELRAAFCRHLGVDIPEAALSIYRADVLQDPRLEPLLKEFSLPVLRAEEPLLVIGNPPYVEAKRLPAETKAALQARYPDALSGAPDLYLYFLHVCLGWVRPADTLAFVLPNKLLVNANAQAIRELLLQERRLRGLWFATQASIFPDAAVYPVVLFAGGLACQQKQSVEVAQVTRGAAGGVVRGEPVPVPMRSYEATSSRAFFPMPEAAELLGALERLLQREMARLGSVLDIRWTVSFHRAGLREQYVQPQRPDGAGARPFIGGGPFSGNGEVTRYQLRWAGWWIRYDVAELQARKNPLPDIRLFEQPKIVICQNGRTLRAAYDDQGYVLKDTFLCGSIPDCDHPLCREPRALVGLLCSRAAHFFYAHVFYGGHVNGGYLHFLRSFLVDVPVGTWTDASANAVAGLVRQRETAVVEEEQAALEEQIEALVSEALGLSESEQAAITTWASGDANWHARERVRAPGRPRS